MPDHARRRRDRKFPREETSPSLCLPPQPPPLRSAPGRPRGRSDGDGTDISARRRKGDSFRASPKAAEGGWCRQRLLSPIPVEGKLGPVEERAFPRPRSRVPSTAPGRQGRENRPLSPLFILTSFSHLRLASGVPRRARRCKSGRDTAPPRLQPHREVTSLLYARLRENSSRELINHSSLEGTQLSQALRHPQSRGQERSLTLRLAPRRAVPRKSRDFPRNGRGLALSQRSPDPPACTRHLLPAKSFCTRPRYRS